MAREDVVRIREFVEIPIDVWEKMQDEFEELIVLRQRVREYEQRDRDYLNWSLGGGMLEAVMAGIELERNVENA